MAQKTDILDLYQAAQQALMALGEAIKQLPVAIPDVLTDFTLVGTIGGRPLYVLTYNNARWFAEIPSVAPKQVVLRGSNVPGNIAVKLLAGLSPTVDKNETKNGGLDQPKGLPDIPGYSPGVYPDKGLYLEYQGATPVLPDTIHKGEAIGCTSEPQPTA